MKKLVIILLGLIAASGVVKAQVTIDVDAGQLRSALGVSAEPVGGLLQLLASPSGTFSAPTSASFTSGDNVVVASFAMNGNSGTAETFNPLNGLAFSTANYTIVTGEALELRFFPTLTYTSAPTSPGIGTTYGQVRSSSIEFGVAGNVPAETAWVVPSAGSTVNLEYVTISNNGTYANATADADSVVTTIPEPSTYALFGAGLLGIVSWRALQRQRNSAVTI